MWTVFHSAEFYHKHGLLFWLICFSFVLFYISIFMAFCFEFSILMLLCLLSYTYRFFFNLPIEYLHQSFNTLDWEQPAFFATHHCGLLSLFSFIILSLVSFDSSFVGSMFLLNWICPTVCGGLLTVDWFAYLSLLLIFVLGMLIIRSFHNFFLSIGLFYDIFFYIALKKWYF